MHEFADELLPGPAGGDWPAVHTFRKAKRAELLANRGTLHLDERKALGASLTQQLLAAVDLRVYPVLGFYWPIRGELDLRGIASRHVEPSSGYTFEPGLMPFSSKLVTSASMPSVRFGSYAPSDLFATNPE